MGIRQIHTKSGWCRTSHARSHQAVQETGFLACTFGSSGNVSSLEYEVPPAEVMFVHHSPPVQTAVRKKQKTRSYRGLGSFCIERVEAVLEIPKMSTVITIMIKRGRNWF